LVAVDKHMHYVISYMKYILVVLRQFEILFLEPPMIDRFRFPRKKQGDRIVVSCVVSTGDQPLKIGWTKDGDTIPPDMGIQIQVYFLIQKTKRV
jgi:hypothetical protein